MKWISVKDKEFPYDQKSCENWVLFYHNHPKHTPNIFVAQGGNYGDPNKLESAFGDGYVPCDIHDYVTHWMPLPEPPAIFVE